MPPDDLPVIGFQDSAGWEAWLAEHHADAAGAWLKIAKKGAAERTVSYADALDVALCYGWIDGQKGGLDEQFWLQRFTPRGPRGRWSQINTGKAVKLIEAGRMRPAGLCEIETARADGRWDAAYAGQATITVPDDLARELARNQAAATFFETISSVNRYAILYRIGDAKRPETRARRIAKYVAMLAEGQTIHP
jgi:uncharacterized protein YdeI (YjbR/CyaY-like superfamily)